ncbi:hypothetical protein AA103581_0601 [Gluconobacter wancherniae NBRC 103581]|nr:hypothetical protein AA103581_0601 [Gluconobacter wancherniae NBRC 103581]
MAASGVASPEAMMSFMRTSIDDAEAVPEVSITAADTARDINENLNNFRSSNVLRPWIAVTAVRSL